MCRGSNLAACMSGECFTHCAIPHRQHQSGYFAHFPSSPPPHVSFHRHLHFSISSLTSFAHFQRQGEAASLSRVGINSIDTPPKKSRFIDCCSRCKEQSETGTTRCAIPPSPPPERPQGTLQMSRARQRNFWIFFSLKILWTRRSMQF